MRIAAKNLWSEEGILHDRVITVENGTVVSAEPGTEGDLSCAWAVPAPIDQHCHGGRGVGAEYSTAEEMLPWLRSLAENGVGQILLTISTAPVPVMRKAMAEARRVMELQAEGAGGTHVAGVHLEGPFISMNALGAMDRDSVIPSTVENWERLSEGYKDIIRLVTLAPENPGADELIARIVGDGIVPQAGHTHASDEEAVHAFETGIRGITHTFNASTPIRHREPGILARAFVTDSVACECICDFIHVHETAVKVIYRCKGPEHMIVVSDAVEPAGYPDGEYFLRGRQCIVKNGANYLVNGTLSGSGTCPTAEARNLIRAGIPVWDVYCMTSRTPARYLGIPGGTVAAGDKAYITCMDENFMPVLTVIGNRVYGGKTE